MGGSFATEASGPGDARIAGLPRLWPGGGQELILNADLSLPTGSLDQRAATPMSMGADVRQPDPMQLGSGTFDLLPGVTWLLQQRAWSFGAQAIGTFRIDENDRGHGLGHRFEDTAWAARRLGDSLSASLRVVGGRRGNAHGADAAQDPMVVPTADPDRIGGKRIDVLAGLNLRPGSSGHRFAPELGAPVFQGLEGSQLETDLVTTLGWRLSR